MNNDDLTAALARRPLNRDEASMSAYDASTDEDGYVDYEDYDYYYSQEEQDRHYYVLALREAGVLY